MRAPRIIVLTTLLAALAPGLAAAPAALPAPAAPAPATPAPFAREQFLSDLGRTLAAHFNLEGDLQLELLRPWSPPDRLAQTWQLDVIEYPLVPSSSMLVRCRMLADGAPAGEGTFIVNAMLWRDAWVARMPIMPNSTFDPSLLETRRVDLFRERDALPAAVGDHSFEFARPIGVGRLLTWHDIQRRPLVRKGSLVEVSATEGQLIITMKGLAMESGAQGDTVTIRNPESRKDFAAMVVDENRVQVRF